MTDPLSWFSPELVLGWRMTKGLIPEHSGRLGEHTEEHVVKALPEAMAHHTVIVAQSGSGKSFFLGRLIEEILLKTRSRVLILDMNSDFRKIALAKESNDWGVGFYDRESGQGFAAEEPSREHFVALWDQISKLVYTTHVEEGEPSKFDAPLLLDWLSFPIDLLVEDADEEKRDELRHCHSLVNFLASHARETQNKKWLESDRFLDLARDFCEKTKGIKAPEEIAQKLVDEFGAKGAGLSVFKLTPASRNDDRGFLHRPARQYPSMAGLFTKSHPDDQIMRAARDRTFVQPDALHFYFSRVFELVHAKLVDTCISRPQADGRDGRVRVVDLGSVKNSRHQKIAMSAFLEAEWECARNNWVLALDRPKKKDERVPTFIVVEEAHNALPDKEQSAVEAKLKDQFRRIAAEGRKFGLFLILVSQRPDKLDRMVMSECENQAIMRVGSDIVLRTTCEVLGFDPSYTRMTAKVLEFERGRALLAGPWVNDEPTLLYSAARRTEEGGRDLRPTHWGALPLDLNRAIVLPPLPSETPILTQVP